LNHNLSSHDFDVAVILDGVNELTLGANAKGLYEHNGSDTHRISTDFNERIAGYFECINAAADLCKADDCRLLVVLQPALFEKHGSGPIERQLLRATFTTHPDSYAMYERPYASMRVGLSNLAENHRLDFLDCSRLLNNESKTTFADLCHLSDPGQAMLGEAIALELAKILHSKT
jgi:hypothetical protein